MIDYKYKDLFLKSHTDKQLKIATDDGLFTATNSDIHVEDFELTESLCSDSELRFGSCESSMVKFQIRNAFIPLVGKWLTVTETLEGNTDVPFQYGRYKVFSDVPTADKEYRDIVAYDAMYDILGADMAAWYNALLPNKDSTVTMKQFREAFIAYFGLEEVAPKDGLVNDSMAVERTIQLEQISGKDIIAAICEINGCFGHIGRDGKFHYIYLPQDIQGLYPADFLFPDHVPKQWDYLPQAETGHLYPQDPKGERMGAGRYKKDPKYEDYVVRQINKLRIRQEENDIGATYPDTEPSDKDNVYIVEDNFLVYGKSTADLQAIAQNLYNKIIGISYRPFNSDCVGNPCMEVGDPVRLMTKYEMVESYILVRRLKGIQALNDNYSSKGTARRTQNANSVQKSIIQLKGKTNALVRNVEETRLEMKDIEKDLQTQITINAGQIDLRVRKDNVIASINLSPETITLEAQRIDLKGLVNADELMSKFATITTLNAEKASLESLIATKATIESLNAVNAEVERINADYASVAMLNAAEASLDHLISQKASIEDLNVTNLQVQSLEAAKVSVNDFNAATANLQNLIAQKIDATTVKADYMEVANWTSSGKIKAERIDVDYLFGQEMSSRVITVNTLIAAIRVSADGLINAPDINCSDFNCNTINGRSVGWETITIGTNSYTVLTG